MVFGRCRNSNGRLPFTVEADFTDYDLAFAARTLRQAMAGIGIPPGDEFDVGGRAEMTADMKQTVIVILRRCGQHAVAAANHDRGHDHDRFCSLGAEYRGRW